MEGTIYKKTKEELLRKQLAELKKQTVILQQIATNTTP
jgi:hypothetical protein